MDEMIVKKERQESIRNFATIGGLHEDGVSLIFDGESEPTQKHYLCNIAVDFAPGDRVKIIADSGTYVVEYVVGPPRQTKLAGIPAGGDEGQVLAKKTDADFDTEWAEGAGSPLPSGGSKGQVLTKKTSADGDVSWDDVPEGLPSGGSKGQVLTKNSGTDGDASWATPATTVNMATNVVNQYNTSESYAIQLRATSASAFEIRRGPYGTWYKITTG